MTPRRFPAGPLIAALAGLLAGLTAVPAPAVAEPEECAVPSDMLEAEASLARLGLRLKARQPVVMVAIGGASTVGQAAGSSELAYPHRLERILAHDFPDTPITVVNKAEGRSTLEVFLHYFKLKNVDVKAQVVIGDNEQGVKTVAGNRNAIGYVSIGTAEYDATHGVPIKLLPIGGVAASTESVRKGSFPLSRPLHLVTRTSPSGLAKAFIEYAQSRAVHDLIKQQYFVPLAD